MLQLLAAILFVGAVLAAAKIAILLLILAGLIFRTKETIGLLLLGGLLTFLHVHPILGFTGLGVIGLIAFLRRKHPIPTDAEASSPEVPTTTGDQTAP